MTNNQYTIHASDSIGCYGTDNAGSPWATFQVFHHTVSCDDCGAEIKSGWQHGRFGKQLTYHCARHVTVIRTPRRNMLDICGQCNVSKKRLRACKLGKI